MMTTIDAQEQQIQGGIYLGGINYQGDLAPSSFIGSFSEAHLDLGAFMYIRPTAWYALKLNYHHGTLSGADANSNAEGRRVRNLSFRSPLDELSASGAFFYSFNINKKRVIEPFLTVGVGVFRFNPKAEYNGIWYELQPLSTEGQGLKNYADRQPYKRIQMCFPLGGGVQMSLTRRTHINFELSFRKTFTDYLDDVSTNYVSLENLRAERGEIAVVLSNRSLTKDALQSSTLQTARGEAKNKDWYIIGSVGLVVNILGKSKLDNLFQKKRDYTNCNHIAKTMR
jgi:hypothetical protein